MGAHDAPSRKLAAPATSQTETQPLITPAGTHGDEAGVSEEGGAGSSALRVPSRDAEAARASKEAPLKIEKQDQQQGQPVESDGPSGSESQVQSRDISVDAPPESPRDRAGKTSDVPPPSDSELSSPSRSSQSDAASPTASSAGGHSPSTAIRAVAISGKKESGKIGSTVSGDGHTCANCKVTKTPLWRRGLNGQVLCNACGLYLKARNIQRPISLQRTPQIRRVYITKNAGSCPGDGRCNGTGGSEACLHCPSYLNNSRRNAALQPAGSEPVNEVKMVSCQNCGTVNTPLWRRDAQGHIICNACGLYNKMHNFTRPAQSKNIIKRRKRMAKSGEEKSDQEQPVEEDPIQPLEAAAAVAGAIQPLQPEWSVPGPRRSPGYVQVTPSPPGGSVAGPGPGPKSSPHNPRFNYPTQYGVPLYEGQMNVGFPYGYMPVPPGSMQMQSIPQPPQSGYMLSGQQKSYPAVSPGGGPLHAAQAQVDRVPPAHSLSSAVPVPVSVPLQATSTADAAPVPPPNASVPITVPPPTTPTHSASSTSVVELPHAHFVHTATPVPVVQPPAADSRPPGFKLGKRKSWDENGDSPLSVLQYLKGASQDTIKEYLLAAQRQLNDKVLQLRRNLEKAEYQLSECENYLQSVNNSDTQ